MPSFRELTGNLKVSEDLTTHIAKSGTLCVNNHQIILHDGVTPGGIVLDTSGENAFGVTGSGTLLVYYNARTNNIAETDPGTGKIEWNTTTQSDANQLYIANISNLGNDLIAIWRQSIGSRLVLQRQNNASIYIRYTITSIVEHGTWFTLGVTPLSSAGLPFSANANLLVAIVTEAKYLPLSGGTLTGPITMNPLPTNASNDAAAAGAGVPVGGIYRNGSVLQIRVA